MKTLRICIAWLFHYEHDQQKNCMTLGTFGKLFGVMMAGPLVVIGVPIILVMELFPHEYWSNVAAVLWFVTGFACYPAILIHWMPTDKKHSWKADPAQPSWQWLSITFFVWLFVMTLFFYDFPASFDRLAAKRAYRARLSAPTAGKIYVLPLEESQEPNPRRDP